MARKKENIEELDEELEKLEAELRALEAGEDPDAGAAEEAPDEGSQAADEDPDKKGRVGALLGKLPFGGGKDEPAEAVEEVEKVEEAEEPIEEPVDEPAQDLADEPAEDLAREPPEEAPEAPDGAPEAPAEEPTEAEDHPAPQAEEVEPPEEETGPLGTLIGKLRRGKGEEETMGAEETDAPEPEGSPEEDTEEEPREVATPEPTPAPEPLADPGPQREAEVAEAWRKRRSQDWEPAEAGGWRRRDPSEAPPEEDSKDEGRARALLARFRGSGDEEEERSQGPFAAQPVPGDEGKEEGREEEDEKRGKPVAWLWILIALLAVGLLAAAAFALLGGDDGPLGGAEAPAAAVAAPTAVTTAEGTPVATVGQAFALDASGSTGEIDEYVWDFDDGQRTTTEEPTVEHTYTAAGTYQVTVTAVGEGGEDEATLEVLAVQAPVAQAEILVGGSPVAAPGEVGNNAFLGQSVQLDASGSSADDQLTLASYAWDIDGDGASDATGEQAEVSFSEVGAWTVSLTVTDELGVTASAEHVVHVANRFQFNDTLAAALAGPTSNEHPFTAGEGREGATPVQISAVLTYTPPAQSVNEDLDLVLVDPDDNEFEATDDDGAGEETITLSGGDLAALGDWTAQVTHEQGGLQEVDYGLVIEVFY